MKVLAATLTLLVSNAAAAQECKTCSMVDTCIKAYLKATSEAQSATKQAIRDWKQNLDRKTSAELSSRGALALQDAMETQVRSEPRKGNRESHALVLRSINDHPTSRLCELLRWNGKAPPAILAS